MFKTGIDRMNLGSKYFFCPRLVMWKKCFTIVVGFSKLFRAHREEEYVI